MDKSEKNLQKLLVNFCKSLHIHVEEWSASIESVKKPFQALLNYHEQFYSTKRISSDLLKNFKEEQQYILNEIQKNAEIDIRIIKEASENLCKIDWSLYSKLHQLNETSLEIDSDHSHAIVLGSANQPPLNKILSQGLEFCEYFSEQSKLISSCIKELNLDSLESIETLRNSFRIDLNVDFVERLLAVTQYIK